MIQRGIVGVSLILSSPRMVQLEVGKLCEMARIV
jgi:hypothetical protein